MKQEIALFHPNIGKRMRYLFQTLLPTRFKNVQWNLLESLADFKQYQGIKINYSEIFIENAHLWVFPEGWLSDGNWRGLQFAKMEQGWVLFPQSKGDYGFDVFSAIFVMLTRAEEYLVQARDEHGRFSVNSSGFPMGMKHTLPWVDIWLAHFQAFLTDKNITVQNHTKSTACMTIDVDNVTAVYGKPLVRQMGGAIKHMAKIGPVTRVKSATDILNDPFYSFPQLKLLHQKHQIPFTFFLLGGDKSNYDKNQAFDSKAYQKAISEIKTWANIGWHPGYYWHDKSTEEQKMEKQMLEKVVGKKIDSVRMHFLRMDVKSTYQQLELLGITNDHTMGFADGIGFRAGTAHPFTFYSLQEERELQVKVHPFVCMDATLNWYLKYTPQQAIEVSEEISNYVKSFGGCLSFLWHNDTVTGFGEWSAWKTVFESQINLLKTCLN